MRNNTPCKYHPGRRMVQLNIAAIAAGGGGIHCTTQQETKGECRVIA